MELGLNYEKEICRVNILTWNRRAVWPFGRLAEKVLFFHFNIIFTFYKNGFGQDFSAGMKSSSSGFCYFLNQYLIE